MEPLLVFPDPPPAELVLVLDRAGYPWKAVTEISPRNEPEDGWAGAIVCDGGAGDDAFSLCRALRKRDVPLEPLLVVLEPARLVDLELREDLFDDFICAPLRAE